MSYRGHLVKRGGPRCCRPSDTGCQNIGMTPSCIAYFVSSHGFGHAARSAAVMEAIHGQLPATRFGLFTGVPRWFFEDSMTAPFDYLPSHTDVGLVQSTPMEEDLSATIRELSNFLPLRADAVEKAAERVSRLGCSLVVSDISPLGIAVASALGLPCVLIENFTWDWIYGAYLAVEPRFSSFIDELHNLYSTVHLRIQARPFCQPVSGALSVAPISRPIRQSRPEILDRLQLSAGSPFVLLTMGGFPTSYEFLDRLHRYSDFHFVIPGGADSFVRQQNLILLPHRTSFQHADLVAAASLVVGKLGYSTLAEVYQAATPYLFMQRRRFPESPALARFAERNLVCGELTEDEFKAANWPSRLFEFQEERRPVEAETTGSQEAADLILDLLENR